MPRASALKTWWNNHLCGPWTDNKLLSRKIWITVVVVFLAIGLDIAGRALKDYTVTTAAGTSATGAGDQFTYADAAGAPPRTRMMLGIGL